MGPGPGYCREGRKTHRCDLRLVADREIGEIGPEPSKVSLNSAVFDVPSVMASVPKVVPLLLFA